MVSAIHKQRAEKTTLSAIEASVNKNMMNSASLKENFANDEKRRVDSNKNDGRILDQIDLT